MAKKQNSVKTEIKDTGIGEKAMRKNPFYQLFSKQKTDRQLDIENESRISVESKESELKGGNRISDKKLKKLLEGKVENKKGIKLGRRFKFFGNLRTKVFDSNEKQAEKLRSFAQDVEKLDEKLSQLSREELIVMVNELREEFQEKLEPGTKIFMERGRAWLETKQGVGVLDFMIDKMPLCFALVREAAKRAAEHRHFEVQLMAGIALSQGRVIEFKTGEGKTLVASLPLFVYSLFGRGAYLVTVNDYLARRDAEWIGHILGYLGVSVGIVNQDKSYKVVNPELLAQYKAPEEAELAKKVDWRSMSNMKGLTLVEVSKKEAYLCDVTYGTNSEFGFDYLRDNMYKTFEDMNQRVPFFCVVDEVDSILIDEARTPLIISDSAEESNMLYQRFAKLVKDLEDEDYLVEEKERTVSLTDSGIRKMEKWLDTDNIWSNSDYAKYLDRTLIATYYYKRDDQYLVHNGEVILVDEFTGRLQPGRRISDGIHQAIEAKEGVEIKRESRTLATVTYQNYFRLYPVLAGMTGTALTEAEEFAKIYNLDVVEIPTNRPMIRQDQDDVIYKNEDAKFRAIAEEIKEKHEKGQPILVGTVSVEKSEKLAQLLKQRGIKHEILNAKNHAREADIVARAGEKGSVTISTNMAGRGTDIKLGKNVGELGGLYVIGTERHESRRIDNQLRGRSGRQGDPGATRFYLALDDEIMRMHGGEMIKTLLTATNVPDDVPFQSKLITRALQGAQRRVEAENFDTRKHLVEFDDVLNSQRLVVYSRRRRIIELFDEAKKFYEENKEKLDAEIKGEGIPETEVRLRDYVVKKLKEQVELLVDVEAPQDMLTEENIQNLMDKLVGIMPKDLIQTVVSKKFDTSFEKYLSFLSENPTKERIKEQLAILVDEVYDEKEKHEGFMTMREIEKYVMLDTIDRLWIDHLENLDDLRTGAELQGYGQKDPLNIYQNEGYELFAAMMIDVDATIAGKVLLYTAKAEREAVKVEGRAAAKSAARLAQEALEQAFKDAQGSGKGKKKDTKSKKKDTKSKKKKRKSGN